MGDCAMSNHPPWLQLLSVEERIKLVEDLLDSIAADQSAFPLTDTARTGLSSAM
jgi:putative addiction module component (TIGR02574 family)